MYITWPHLHHTHFVKPFNSCCLKQVLGMFYYDISLYLVWYFNDLVKINKKKVLGQNMWTTSRLTALLTTLPKPCKHQPELVLRTQRKQKNENLCPEIQSLTRLSKSYHTSALTTPTDFLYENQHCLDIMCQSASHLAEDTLFQCGSRKLRQDIQQMENSAYTAKAFRKHHHKIIFYVKKKSFHPCPFDTLWQ